MPNRETKDRLARWVLVTIFVCLAAGIVATGYLYYRNHERHFSAEVGRQLSAIADLKAGELVQWRKERLEDAGTLFHNAAFTTLVRRFFEQPDDVDGRRQLQEWIGRIQTNSQYDRVVLLDARGVLRLSAPDTPEPLGAHLVGDAAAVLRSGQVTFVDFHRDSPTGPIHLGLLVPILDESNAGNPLGVLIFRIDPATYLYPFIQRWPIPSLTAETLLVRREGDEVVFLNELRFQRNTALTRRPLSSQKAMPAARAALGQEGIMDGIDYRGVPVEAALRAIPDSPWFLVARMDIAEVYAPLREQLTLVVALISALLVGAGAGIALLWRQQRVRYYQERAEAAVRFRRLFEAARDGILILNAETGMIVEVNPFLVEMLGYTHEQFLGKRIWEVGLFRDIVANQDNFAELQRKEYLTYEDKPLETADGRRIEVEFVSHCYLVNHQKVMQCNIRDITERKQAEAALVTSEERFRTATESLTDVVYDWDIKEKVDWYGDIDGIMGYPPGEFPRTIKGWAATIHPEDKDRVMAALEGHLKGVAPYVAEYRVERRDGERRWWSARGTALRDDRGEPYKMIGSITDITERKRAEEALRENEARYRTLIENIPQKILMKDRNCRWISINKNLARDFGFRPEEVVGKTDAELFTPELAAKYHADDVRIMETGKTEELEEKYLLDGRETWVNTIKTPVRGTDGEIVGMLGVFWDITERKQAEEALRESERRLRELTESLPQLLWTCRVTGLCDYLSPQWVAYTGIPEKEQLGFGWLEQLYPEDRAPTIARWNAAVGAGAYFDIEFRIRRNDGVYRWFKTRALPLRDREGRVVKWFGTNSDIDDQKLAEEQVRRSLADLERSNKELEQFAYVASHDLQEPLRMISSYTQLLAQRYEGQLDDKARKYIHYAVDGAIRMQALINDLLAYSRVGTRGKPLEPTDSHAVLGGAIRNLAVMIEESRAIITNDDLPTVRADASQLVLVFQNLIANAIKFRREDLPRVHVSVQEHGGEWIFSVKDNGIGIEPQHAERAFVIFQRLHTRAEYPGTGIGLAVCKRIVERHGGKIWFESEPGTGTTFFFTIPK